MRCLFQRNFRTSVKRENEGRLLAETVYSDMNGESAAQLLVDAQSFVIDKACLEIHREIAGGETRTVEQLTGIEAYLGSGPELKQALKCLDDPVAAGLFAETIRGLVQAETFLFKERGFASASEYGRHWERMYAGSCRYYSNLERITRQWDTYVGEGERAGYLFLRAKTYFLYGDGPDTYLICGGLTDTFHEMNVSLKVSQGKIQAAEGNMLRVPDDVCREATELLPNAGGVGILASSKKELSGLMGGGQGCVHLIDIVDDSINTLKLYLQCSGRGYESFFA